MVRKTVIWTIGIVIGIWAVVLRVYGIGQQSYWIDESYSIAIAQAIAQHGYPLLDSGSVIWRAPMFHYLLGGMVAVFGDGYVATRILSVIFGVITICLLTYIAKRWFSKSAACITFVLLTFSYWEIAWSRQARMYMLFQVCFWLTLLLFERWYKGRVHWGWFLATTIVTIAVHQLGWILLGCMALWLVIQRYERKPFVLPFAIPYVGVIVGCIVGVALLSYFTTDIGIVQYWTHYIHFLWREHWVVIILSAIGLCVAVVKSTNKFPLWLTGIFLVGLGVVSYSLPLLQYRYIFFLLPILYLLSAHAISLISNKYVTTLVVATLVVFAPGFTLLPQTHYALESDATTSQRSYKSFTPQPDFAGVYKVIHQYNPEVLITPYPSISRLYERTDTAALYVDLTGTIKQAPTVETYTGVPYVNMDTLEALRAENRTGIILVDVFAEHRVNAELLQYIKTYGTVMYTHSQGDWSRVTLYSI